jgi:hypothetical protein
MNIEIKLPGGVLESGDVSAKSLDELAKALNSSKEPFLVMENPRGPFIINTSRILSVRKK